MINWQFNSKEYTARDFGLIPEGNYKVTINNVVEKVFNSGNEGFEITLDVPGHNEKLWHYLVLDPNNSPKTNQRIGMFFDSFSIQDTNLSNYGNWIGKDGAVRVKHDMYNGSKTAKVAFCLSRSQQNKIDRQSNSFATNNPPMQNQLQSRALVLEGFNF